MKRLEHVSFQGVVRFMLNAPYAVSPFVQNHGQILHDVGYHPIGVTADLWPGNQEQERKETPSAKIMDGQNQGRRQPGVYLLGWYRRRKHDPRDSASRIRRRRARMISTACIAMI